MQQKCRFGGEKDGDGGRRDQVTVETEKKKKQQNKLIFENETKPGELRCIVVLMPSCTKQKWRRLSATSATWFKPPRWRTFNTGGLRGIRTTERATEREREREIAALFMDLLNLSIYQRLMLSRQRRVSVGQLSSSHSFIMKEKIQQRRSSGSHIVVFVVSCILIPSFKLLQTSHIYIFF